MQEEVAFNEFVRVFDRAIFAASANFLDDTERLNAFNERARAVVGARSWPAFLVAADAGTPVRVFPFAAGAAAADTAATISAPARDAAAAGAVGAFLGLEGVGAAGAAVVAALVAAAPGAAAGARRELLLDVAAGVFPPGGSRAAVAARAAARRDALCDVEAMGVTFGAWTGLVPADPPAEAEAAFDFSCGVVGRYSLGLLLSRAALAEAGIDPLPRDAPLTAGDAERFRVVEYRPCAPESAALRGTAPGAPESAAEAAGSAAGGAGEAPPPAAATVDCGASWDRLIRPPPPEGSVPAAPWDLARAGPRPRLAALGEIAEAALAASGAGFDPAPLGANPVTTAAFTGSALRSAVLAAARDEGARSADVLRSPKGRRRLVDAAVTILARRARREDGHAGADGDHAGADFQERAARDAGARAPPGLDLFGAGPETDGRAAAAAAAAWRRERAIAARDAAEEAGRRVEGRLIRAAGAGAAQSLERVVAAAFEGFEDRSRALSFGLESTDLELITWALARGLRRPVGPRQVN